jgi:hypothetical protein
VSLYRKGDRNGKVDRVENDAVLSTATITAASSPMLNVGVDNDVGGAIGGLSPLIPDDNVALKIILCRSLLLLLLHITHAERWSGQ